jgi:CrcB protein
MRDMMLRYLAIGAAGFVGSLARYVVGSLFGRLNTYFPFGTLVINLTGSLFLGWFLTRCDFGEFSQNTRLAIGTGFVGAYTTFSTYMYESSKLAEGGAGIKAALNIVGSVVLGLICVRLGVVMARRA